MTVENLWIEMIRTVGFPIMMTLWFMFRTEKALKALTEAVNNLSMERRNK